MKKFLTWILVMTVAFTGVVALADDIEEDQDAQMSQIEEDGSEFEKVLVKKGALLKKEFLDCCIFQEHTYYNRLTFQTACLTDIETGDVVYALRVTGHYYNSKYDKGDVVGVMDADEIDGAISTLKYIKEHISESKDYTEIIYTADTGMSIGAYHSGSEDKLFIKFDRSVTMYYDVSTIDELIAALSQVKDTFQ